MHESNVLWSEWVSEPPLLGNHYYDDFTFWAPEDQLDEFLRDLKLESAPQDLVKVGAEFLFGEAEAAPTNAGVIYPARVEWSVLRAIENGFIPSVMLPTYDALAVLVRELDPERPLTPRKEGKRLEALTLRAFIDLLANRGLQLSLNTTRNEEGEGGDVKNGSLILSTDEEIVASLLATARESQADADMLKVRSGLDDKYLRQAQKAPGKVRVTRLFRRLFMTDRRLVIGFPGSVSAARSDPWATVRALNSTVR